jgi:hypothetical protein
VLPERERMRIYCCLQAWEKYLRRNQPYQHLEQLQNGEKITSVA